MGKRRRGNGGIVDDSTTKSKKRKLGHEDDRECCYTDIIKENKLLETYYQGQGIVPAEEWTKFMDSLKTTLPVTFRITGSKAWACSVLSCLQKKYFVELSDLKVDGKDIPPPRPLEWYPDRLAWHISLSRQIMRNSPHLSKFHSFLVQESDQGNISRQEAVSMIPPLLLGVESHHNVLDMCAAPGSKTSQIIESLHHHANTDIPSGVVIANDADNKRCYMLVHQAKRLNSVSVMVTNHDASAFPVLYYHDEANTRHPLEYDRVLCDVPCSGDGTLRKNPAIWKKWNPGQSLSLHKLQLRILVRGLELLKDGGRLVYSTCSFNPIEDEAVVSAAITIAKGSVELMDVSNELESLRRCEGLTTWKVMSKDGVWLSSLEETPPSSSHMVQSSMFPPIPEEVESFHLQRCMRILPHHQDTGGFFVAVLCKIKPLPWQAKSLPTFSNTVNAEEILPLEKKPIHILGKPAFIRNKRSGFKEDPFVFLDYADPMIQQINSCFNLPKCFKCQFLARSHSSKKKTLYLTTPLVKELTIRNEKDCNIINTGVRVMARCDQSTTSCPFRLTQEGVETLFPYISNCHISVNFTDLITLLSSANPLNLSLSMETQHSLRIFGCMKPAIFVYTPSNDQLTSDINVLCPVCVSGWVAGVSVRLFLSQKQRYHYLSILGQTPPDHMSLTTQGSSKNKDEVSYDSDVSSD